MNIIEAKKLAKEAGLELLRALNEGVALTRLEKAEIAAAIAKAKS